MPGSSPPWSQLRELSTFESRAATRPKPCRDRHVAFTPFVLSLSVHGRSRPVVKTVTGGKLGTLTVVSGPDRAALHGPPSPHQPPRPVEGMECARSDAAMR